MSTPEFSCDDREGRASGQGGISIPDDRSVNTHRVQPGGRTAAFRSYGFVSASLTAIFSIR